MPSLGRIKRFVARQRHRLGFAYRAERELLIFAAVISVVNKGQIYSRGSRAAENLYIHGNRPFSRFDVFVKSTEPELRIRIPRTGGVVDKDVYKRQVLDRTTPISGSRKRDMPADWRRRNATARFCGEKKFTSS